MYFEAMAIAAELRDYPGGPTALAKSIMPTIEGMRILRWPADRLDTLGGYLTYHNVTLFTYFLGLFAVMQGARLVRHLEEEKTIEFYLSTGVSRSRIIWLRSSAYFSYQLIISLSLGLGTAFAMSASGEPNFSGSVITLLAGGICIFPFFALGLLISQFLHSAKTATGVGSILVTVLYILGNLADKYSWLTWIKYASPFYYANLSRPIIPGFDTNYLSWFFMMFIGVGGIWCAVKLFERRDIGATTFALDRHDIDAKTKEKATFVPASLVGDMIWRGRYAIVAWVLTTSAFIGVFISLMSGVVDIWEKFDFLQQFSSSGFGKTAQQQYLAMVYEILPPFITAFIITQAAKWTADLRQGRVQLFLSSPITWNRLISARFIATMIVSEILILSVILTSIVGSQLQNVAIYPAAIARVFLLYNLLAIAFTSLCTVIVLLLRGKNPTHLLSIYVGAAWLIVFMAPYLKWPEWTVRISIFDAFGHPFVAWPDSRNFAVIALLTIPSLLLSYVLAHRTPKVT